MAGLEALSAMIYHERQQEGSMLCAQHALNSLLQGNYFTAPDLASIARSFDTLEHNALEGGSERSASQNMDDTGFFSVQVMDKALDVWGLHLVRWRSEQMRPYQESPHKILAFVLNLHQHWFTLRRFGPARTDPDSDPGEGHWFNLNSQYVAPKWVSRTYLGMFLHQSEQEGYSVFAVIQADPAMPLALPRTEADHLAATLDGPDSHPGHSSTSSIPGAFPGDEATSEVIIPDDEDYDINSEDVELQAALAASLSGAGPSFGHNAYVPQAPVPAPPLRHAPPPPALHDDDMDDEPIEVPDPRGADVDPVAASMARNRQMLERMQRMQEAALRETYEDEAAGRLQPPQRTRTQEEEELDELNRAIAASVAERNLRGEGEEEEVRLEGEEEIASARNPLQPVRSSTQGPSVIGAGIPSEEVHRVYDDEDAQLQEALRASLQTMPEGFVHPPTPPQRDLLRPTPSSSAPEPAVRPADSAGTSLLRPEETDEDDNATERTSSPPPPPPQVDVEEMRRRRLARFGG